MDNKKVLIVVKNEKIAKYIRSAIINPNITVWGIGHPTMGESFDVIIVSVKPSSLSKHAYDCESEWLENILPLKLLAGGKIFYP